ncbi:MAG: caspase family protein [Bacteroidota bacterium]
MKRIWILTLWTFSLLPIHAQSPEKHIVPYIDELDPIHLLKTSPEGKYLAYVADKNLLIWDLEAGKVQKPLNLEKEGIEIYDFAFNYKEDQLMLACKDEMIRKLSLKKGVFSLDRVKAFPYEDVIKIRPYPNGNWLVLTNRYQDHDYIWGPTFLRPRDSVQKISRSADQAMIKQARRGKPQTILLTKDDEAIIKGGKAKGQYNLDSWGYRIRRMDVHPQKDLLALALEKEGRVVIYNHEEEKEIRNHTEWIVNGQFAEGQDWLFDVAYSPDGQVLAAGGRLSEIFLFDAMSDQQVGTLSGGTHAVMELQFMPGNRLLVSRDTNNILHIFDWKQRKLLLSFASRQSGKTWLAYTPSGTYMTDEDYSGCELGYREIGELQEKLSSRDLDFNSLLIRSLFTGFSEDDFLLAKQAFDKGQYRETINLLEGFLGSDVADKSAMHFLRGQAYKALNNLEKAKEDFYAAGTDEAYFEIARILENINREEALEALSKIEPGMEKARRLKDKLRGEGMFANSSTVYKLTSPFPDTVHTERISLKFSIMGKGTIIPTVQLGTVDQIQFRHAGKVISEQGAGVGYTYQDTIRLQAGVNEIKIAASTGRQFEWKDTIRIFYEPISEREDIALFFVNEKYEDKAWKELKFPYQNAKSLKKVLESAYGFQCKIYRDYTREQIKQTLVEWKKHSFKKDAQLMVFFSGHGIFDEDLGGFYVSAKGKTKRTDPYRETLLKLNDLEDILNRFDGCKNILLAIDACYSGTIMENISLRGNGPDWGRTGNKEKAEQERKVAEALTVKSRIILTSGGKEQTPDKSQFANQFLKALEENKEGEYNYLTIDDLKSYLQHANPTPRYGEMRSHVEEGKGGFIFTVRKQP